MTFAARTLGGALKLAVTIPAGVTSSGTIGNHNFGTITPTITNGSGSYTYAWHESDDGFGIWTAAGTASTQGVNVTNVGSGGTTAVASYYLTLTDTGTGQTANSNTASYSWTHN